MREHPNAVRIRGLFQAFRDRDLAAIQAAIPEHAVWHFPGRQGALAGSHRRPRRDPRVPRQGRGAHARGRFRFEIEDVIANDTSAVGRSFAAAAAREGRTLDNPTCLRMRIEDGQIVEIWEFVWDLYAVDAFWS